MDVFMLFQATEYTDRSSLTHAHFRGLFKTIDDARNYITHNKDRPYFKTIFSERNDANISVGLSTDSGIWVWKYEVKVGVPYSDSARWLPDYYIVVRERVYEYPKDEVE